MMIFKVVILMVFNQNKSMILLAGHIGDDMVRCGVMVDVDDLDSHQQERDMNCGLPSHWF